MRLWSKGLGKLILPFYISEAEKVEIVDDSVQIEGRIVEKKVNWPYKINLYLEDMLTFTRFMASSDEVIYFIKSQVGYRFIWFVLVRMIKVTLLLPVVLFEKFLSLFRRKRKEVQSV